MSLRKLATLIAAAALLVIAACGGDDDSGDGATNANGATPVDIPSPAVDRSGDPYKIVVSLPIFADFVREIGGDHVEVTTLIPAGVDPHTYQPSEELGAAVEEATIILYNGLGLDGPTASFIESHLADRPPYVIDFARNVPSPTTEQPVDRPIYAKDVGDDPHLFLDPVLAPVYPETVADTLNIVDGENEAYYDARYHAYRAKLDALHTRIQSQMAALPEANRGAFVIYHDSLVHFGRRYGLTVAGTLEADGEQAIRQLLSGGNIRAVFTEAGLPDETLAGLAEEAGVDVCELYTDNVPSEDVSYLEMMEHDAGELERCLGG